MMVYPVAAAESTSTGGGHRRSTSVPAERNSRLSAAVAAMEEDGDDDDASEAISSLTSPSQLSSSTDGGGPSSASSYASSGYRSGAGGTDLVRTKSIRKQSSQPGASTSDIGSQSMDAIQAQYEPPQADRAAGMSRSHSSFAMSDGHATGSQSLNRPMGSKLLGRSKEIPRSASRGSRHARQGSAPNVLSITQDSQSHRCERSESADQDDPLQEKFKKSDSQKTLTRKTTVADGFGGFIEVDAEDDEQPSSGTPTPEASAPSSADLKQIVMSSGPPMQAVHATVASVHHMDRYAPRVNAEETAEETIAPSLPRSQSQPVHVASGTRGQSSALDSQQPPKFRVGSFYAPNGAETARIDDGGSNDMTGSDSGSCVSFSDASGSTQSSGYSSAPRSHYMDSPGPVRSRLGHRSTASEISGTCGSEVSATSSGSQQSGSIVAMRSVKGFRGLMGAERGESMVSFDALDRGFVQGQYIRPGFATDADDESILLSARPKPEPFRHSMHKRQASAPAVPTAADMSRSASSLERHGTLISAAANPARRSKDLSRVLGNKHGKLAATDSEADSPTSSTANARRFSSNTPIYAPPAALEQSRSSKSRVDVDLMLESDLVVEGGLLKGRLEIKVRRNPPDEGKLMLTQPKVRVVGFEELLNDDTRHIFYHYATVIDGMPKIGNGPARPYILHGSPVLSPEVDNRRPLACFGSAPDAEGYCLARDGNHSIPFSLELPVGKGAKGSFRSKHAVVRYIVIGSVKLKNANGSNPSIAHFYRHVDLFPYLNPAVVLSSSLKPILARANKSLFLGGSGKVYLCASLHRQAWVAGQRLYVTLRIDNETSKKVKSLSFSLIRNVVLYRPRPEFDLGLSASDDVTDAYIDPDACATSTSRKKVAEDVLEMGQKGAKGLVTARGWWTGVEAGTAIDISHNIKIPVSSLDWSSVFSVLVTAMLTSVVPILQHDALSITRGRHVAVSYSLRVSAGSSLSSDVSVELPVRIVNFVSLDPPPIKNSITNATHSWMKEEAHSNPLGEEAPMVERVRSADALRSPQKLYGAFVGGVSTNGNVQAGHGDTLTVPGMPVQDQAKRLQHQKSLDFINHAIRSATARRGGQGPPVGNHISPHGLGIEVDEASPQHNDGGSIASTSGPIHPSCLPYEHGNQSSRQTASAPESQRSGVVSNDVGDDLEDELNIGQETLHLNDESVADIDYVIGSAQLDGGESSPAFQQRMRFEGEPTNESYDNNTSMSTDGDVSTETVTAACVVREEDEFDEEEERLASQPRMHAVRKVSQRALSAEPEGDDGPTPVARSPPKFQTTSRREPSLPGAYAENPDESGYSSSATSVSDYSNSSSVSQQTQSTSSGSRLAGKRMVRTGSDVESNLGRQSTIILGPTSKSRPVSPSKQAPSPTKSAMKTKPVSSRTAAEILFKSSAAVKQRMQGQANTQAQAQAHSQRRGGPSQHAPPMLRAKVSQSQLPRAAAKGSNATSGVQRQPTQSRTAGQTRGSLPRPAHVPADSDSEISSSDATTSPATSSAVSTPPDAAREVDMRMYSKQLHGAQQQQQQRSLSLADRMGGLGIHGDDRMSVDRNALPPKVPEKDASVQGGLPHSLSTHNLRGSTVVVPSVRDKIAVLESRKRALKHFTGPQSPSSAASSNSGTPQGSGAASDAGQPARVQASGAARQRLLRHDSHTSDLSSVSASTASTADYMKQTPSVASFKAPLFR